MKQLVLAEKPSVAKDLAKCLGATQKQKHFYEGKQYIVTWALGHLMTLKMPEDIQKEWATWTMETLPMLPQKIGIKPLPKSMPQLKAIKQLIHRQDVTGVVIATDAGREGELVARWILEFTKCQKPFKRLWISSQTDKAIKQGFQQLQDGRQYNRLYESALARATADWLVGLNVTRALTVKYEDNLSAGRVQTPTLSLVRQQEVKIESFIPQTYFTVNVTLNGVSSTLSKRFKEHIDAESVAAALVKKKAVIRAINTKEHAEKAPLPYDLTELQRDANHRYQFSAKKTLSLVQSLYETHKIVTYPRTDSKYLTEDLKSTMLERLHAIVSIDDRAKGYIKQGGKIIQQAVFQSSKVTDHHALIPTEQMPKLAALTGDELKIYRLIVQRFLGLFAPVYRVETTKMTVDIGDETVVFSQQTVLDWGWKDVGDQKGKINGQIGDSVSVQALVKKEITSPPGAMNEGTLLAEMEKHHLGTPATRAEIIEKLIKSELMERTVSKLNVTPKGRQLLQLVNPALVSSKLTEQWELSLENIANGKEKIDIFLKGIREDTQRLVKEIKMSEAKYRDFAMTTKKCPECGYFLREKNTREGKIFVCSNNECSYRRRKDLKVSNHRCASCHRKMAIIEGKNGAYFKCNYCQISEKIESKNQKSKKITKHEEKRLLKKINESQVSVESPFAALKNLVK